MCVYYVYTLRNQFKITIAYILCYTPHFVFDRNNSANDQVFTEFKKEIMVGIYTLAILYGELSSLKYKTLK